MMVIRKGLTALTRTMGVLVLLVTIIGLPTPKPVAAFQIILQELCDGKDNTFEGKVDEGFPDTDGDGRIDCLDPDDENDGVTDTLDNCPQVSNPDQTDINNDKIGDICAQAGGSKLIASDAAAGDNVGYSVSIDGDTAIVGRLDNSADIFTRDLAGRWSQQAKLTASDVAAGQFGYSVSIDSDTALVGAYGSDSSYGAAYVFTRDSSGAWTQQAKLTASDAGIEGYFGRSVSIDGDTALIGANGIRSSAAYVFTRNPTTGVWSEQAKLTASDATSGRFFGRSVSVSGNTAIVGAQGGVDTPYGGQRGAAHVFTRDSAGTWDQQARLAPSYPVPAPNDPFSGPPVEHDLFGVSVSIDGNTAIIGSDFSFSDPWTGVRRRGSVYIFTRDSSTGIWKEQAKFTPTDVSEEDIFGRSVSIDGDTAIVGARGGGPVDQYGPDRLRRAGSAYVFARDQVTGIWKEQSKLTAPDAADYDQFGFSVAISKGTALVGAPKNDDSGTDSGSAYAYENSSFATEVCDGRDNDVDGLVDEGFPDTDGDKKANCGGTPLFEKNDTRPEALAMAQKLALQYLQDIIGKHGIKSLNDLTVKRVEVDELAMAHIRFQQAHGGVPVWGGEAIVHLYPDGSLFTITDGLISDIVVDTIPKITPEIAIEKATAEAFKGCGCGKPPINPESDLWIIRRDTGTFLAYRVQLSCMDGANGPAAPVYLIDAHTSEVVFWYDNLQTLLPNTACTSTPDKVESPQCVIAGCSGELCVSSDDEVIGSTCQWLPEYACYQPDLTQCEVQTNGQCGWTKTAELDTCLVQATTPSPEVCDGLDNDVDGSVDEDFPDTDGDREANCVDPDDDGDGVADVNDAFPLDPTESVDTDGDSTGNNADTNDDNDVVTDGADDFPLDPKETTDTDSDSTGNNTDTDDDKDGVSDDDELVAGSETNSAPTNPVLLFPPNNALNVSKGVTFQWERSVDSQGDRLVYTLCLRATDEDFTNDDCKGVTQSATRGKVDFYVSVGTSTLLAGLVFMGGPNGRKRRALAVIAITLMTGTLLTACGHRSGESGENVETFTVSEPLKEKTTYFWKVIAEDGRGGRSESEVRSFTTGL